MNRVISILLCLCGAVVCAFVAFLGHKQGQNEQTVAVELPAQTCAELLESVPKNLSKFTLKEFKPGKHFVHYDDNEDGEWEQVWVPMFPSSTKKLEMNYRAVIVSFVDTPNQEALFKKLDNDGIDAEYWFSSQTLDDRSYNGLAEKYSSLDFSRSILVYSGYPNTEVSFGTYLLWGGSAGALLSLLIFGWQSFSLVIAGIKSESKQDDDDEVIINRAGLPTKEKVASEYDI